MEIAENLKEQEVKHLWEYDHPYYCETGNFFQRGYNTVFESWADFAQEISGTFAEGLNGSPLYDPAFDELNLLFRWDWNHYEDGKDEYGLEHDSDVLQLFYVQQRKSYNSSAEVKVTVEDEPAVRQWLILRAQSMRNLWEPFLSFDESLKAKEDSLEVSELQ